MKGGQFFCMSKLMNKSENYLWFIVFLHSDHGNYLLSIVCYVSHFCANANNFFFIPLLGLILLFYAALYAFLAAMFGGCLFCLMWSISPYHPTINDNVMTPGK